MVTLKLYFLFAQIDTIQCINSADDRVIHTVMLSRRFVISHFGQLFVGRVYGTPNEIFGHGEWETFRAGDSQRMQICAKLNFISRRDLT